MTNDSREAPIDRRRFLALSGSAGATALAGCSDIYDPGTATPSETASPTERPTETETETATSTPVPDPYGVHVSMTNTEPARISWNMHNPSGQAQISQYAIHDSLAKFNYARGEFTPSLISEWQFASDTSSLELTVRDGAVWSNGDAITAGDVKRQLELGTLVGESYADYVGTISVPDDSTVEIALDSDVHPRIVEFDIFENTVLFTHESNYQTFLDTSATSPTAASENYQNFKDQNPIGSGLFAFESSDAVRLTLVPNEYHPDYDPDLVNYDYEFEFPSASVQAQQLLLNNAIDSAFSMFTPPEIVADFPDAVEEVQIPAKFGFGLVPNHSHAHLGDRAVRQAIAYVVDRPAVVTQAGPHSKQACPKPMGIPSDDQKRWLEGAYADFDSYGPNDGEVDTASATTVLEDAGYSVDGTVTDSSGSTVSFDLTVPQGWSDWLTAAETVVSQLNSFGFDVTLDAQPFGDIIDTLWPNADFDLVAGSWLPGGGKASFPYFPLRYQLIDAFWEWTFNYPAANSNRGGSNAAVTVPSRTGSGDMTVNPTDRLAALSETNDEALTREIVTEQAWVTNQDLPVIPVCEKLEQSWLTNDVWAIPPTDAEVAQVKWPNTWLPRKGEMAYTGESDTETET